MKLRGQSDSPGVGQKPDAGGSKKEAGWSNPNPGKSDPVCNALYVCHLGDNAPLPANGHNGVVWCRTVGDEFEGVKPTPSGVGQRLEARGSEKEAWGSNPLDPHGKSDPDYSSICIRVGDLAS
jgi:hypothetical protein